MISVHLQSGEISVRDTPVPARPPGFALVKMIAAGICNTDLELQRGYYGFSGIPGHEFVGEVVEANTEDLIGQRVAGEINLGCGKCAWCEEAMERHCPERAVLGIVKHPGAFAEYLTLPERNLRVIPERILTEHAVFIEPLAAACEILDQVSIPAGREVAVLGDGKLGLLIAQVLHVHGARVTLYGRHADNMLIAWRRGIDTSADPKRPKARYPLVVECTGSASALGEAIGMAQPRGTVVMKSTVHGTVTFDAAGVIVQEITLVGSRCGRFEPAIELLAGGKIDVADMIAAEYPLREAPAAFAHAAKRGVLKVLLRNT